jgi:hypothetical protein
MATDVQMKYFRHVTTKPEKIFYLLLIGFYIIKTTVLKNLEFPIVNGTAVLS